MPEIPEKTRREMMAGRLAALRFDLESSKSGMRAFTHLNGRVALVQVTETMVTLRVKGPNGTIDLSEPLLDFPSETLVTQCTLVAG